MSRARKAAEYAVFDDLGRRVCPDCRRPLVKKDPLGRGRYPKRCADCKAAA